MKYRHPADCPLKYGCKERWEWVSNHADLEAKGDTVIFHPQLSNGTAAIRANKVLESPIYYWEIDANNIFGTSVMFGVASTDQEVDFSRYVNGLGQNDLSWGLSHKGLIWHNGESEYFTSEFDCLKPVTIGLLLDRIAGTLSYYKNGKPLGIAFRNLNKVEVPLYPYVSCTAARLRMTLLNCQRSYDSLQDRCREVIVKNFKINALPIPKTIHNYLQQQIYYN